MAKAEKYGFRDLRLSSRHRLYGADCPMVDIDFLGVEYFSKTPKAIIEYKHIREIKPEWTQANYQTLINLGNMADLPVYVTLYDPDRWAFQVHAGNALAQRIINNPTVLNEQRYYAFLCYLRGIEPQENILRTLNEI